MEFDDDMYEELLETFSVELKEECESLTSLFLELENTEDKKHLGDLLKKIFRTAHNIKGAAASVSIDKIVDISHKLEDMFAKFKKDISKPTRDEIDSYLEMVDDMRKAFNDFINLRIESKDEKITEVQSEHSITVADSESVEHYSTTSDDDVYIKVKTKTIQQANVKVDDVFMSHMKMQNIIALLGEQKSEIDFVLRENSNDSNNKINIKEVKDGVKRLGESVCEIQNEMKEVCSTFLLQSATLQEVLRSMRLVPITTTLMSLQRIVRDTAKNLGKEINFNIENTNIEVDKLILEKLKDPLTHIVRNAVDHGVESTNERMVAGKSATGNISISAKSFGGSIEVRVKDDGRGVNVETIKEIAIKKGLISVGYSESLTNDSAIDLLFIPGFSTKETVSNVSGRGVGMDVVRSNVESIKGSVSIESVLDEGTTCILNVPLTLATERGVLVKVDNTSYIIPSLLLSNIMLIKVSDIKAIDNGEIYMMGSELITVFSLSNILGENLKDKESTETELYGVLLQRMNKKIIILVDEILSEHDCVVKPLGTYFNNFKLVSGGVLTARGEVVLMLDPGAIFNIVFSMNQRFNINKSSNASASEKKTKILVVDDSITTRTLEVNILNANGYDADGAVNGKVAWEKIRHTKYDAIITDVEMPIMDGYELTKMIKSDKKLGVIPVIMISSNEGDEFKEKGVDVGVDLYIVKKHFDSTSLSDALNKVV
ncbi:MAG: response regulator [Francisellaceae bacterium]|jgi:two-component system, chemotaxis family, sensor kinase CheA|nr:response regulator [Francisellaceae bacterium]